MRTIYKYTIFFFISYFFLSISLTFLLFSWMSFGGNKNLNFFQNIIIFCFSFPSNYLHIKNYLLNVLIDSAFWSAIFYIIIKAFNKIKNRFKAV